MWPFKDYFEFIIMFFTVLNEEGVRPFFQFERFEYVYIYAVVVTMPLEFDTKTSWFVEL